MTHATVLYTLNFLGGRFILMCIFSRKIESFESAQGPENPVKWRPKFKRQPGTCDMICDETVFSLKPDAVVLSQGMNTTEARY